MCGEAGESEYAIKKEWLASRRKKVQQNHIKHRELRDRKKRVR
jgi:hypothetical protein